VAVASAEACTAVGACGETNSSFEQAAANVRRAPHVSKRIPVRFMKWRCGKSEERAKPADIRWRHAADETKVMLCFEVYVNEILSFYLITDCFIDNNSKNVFIRQYLLFPISKTLMPSHLAASNT
jgi:hypothetical protein